MSSLNQRYELITRNLAEVIRGDHIKLLLTAGPLRKLKIYWGTAPTGKPHLGYFIPLIKIADFLQAGCCVTILLADLHATLDNLKSSHELVQARTEYYKFILIEMLKVLGVNVDNVLETHQLRIEIGSSYQLEKKYMFDLLKLCTLTSVRESQRASAEVVKQTKNPLISNLVYPLMQALDEEYLSVDIQFGGVDQRKIFMYSSDNMAKIGYQKRAYLMNPLIPGLAKTDSAEGQGGQNKMSSSNPNSKIELDDSIEIIRKKFSKSYSVDGIGLEDSISQDSPNPLLSLLKYLIFPINQIRNTATFKIGRAEKWGGPLEFTNYQDFETAFIASTSNDPNIPSSQKVCSADVKPAVAEWIAEFLEPVRKVIELNHQLLEKAYP